MLARIWGADAADVRSNGSSVGALRTREMLIVLDVTGSFRDEIGQAREASMTLLDTISENGFPADKLGMVTFVGAADVFTELQRVAPNYASIRTQWNEIDWCNRDYAPFTLAAYSDYFHPAPQMISCNEGGDSWADSGTNQGSGLEAAVAELSDADATERTALKTIILISDGKPQCVPEGTICDDDVAEFGIDQADAAAEERISIFSVSFNDTYNEEQSRYLESLIRGYGRFYETPNAEDLPDILAEIAASIPVSIVQ